MWASSVAKAYFVLVILCFFFRSLDPQHILLAEKVTRLKVI